MIARYIKARAIRRQLDAIYADRDGLIEAYNDAVARKQMQRQCRIRELIAAATTQARQLEASL